MSTARRAPGRLPYRDAGAPTRRRSVFEDGALSVGARLTPRDMELVRWICRHGLVTPQQVALRFFAHGLNHPGQRAAYRRLAKLADLHLLQRNWIAVAAPQVLRVTRTGANLAGVGLGPAELVLAEIHHALRVVDITEEVLATLPTGWILITEREVRADVWRRRRAGQSVKGRIPDAIFQAPDGSRIAVEVDETSKRSRFVDQIIADYRYGDAQYAAIWWFVPGPQVAERMRQIVADNQASDLITVREWQG